MDIFWSSVELTRVVFLLGAILALLYKKKFGITPGGVIVPGTLAGILFASFLAFIITIISAIACYIIYKFTFGRYALERRWSSLIMVTISTIIGLILMWTLEVSHVLSQELMMVTLVAPGLIAISARKYHLGKVIIGTLSVTAICYIIGWVLLSIVPIGLLTHMSVDLDRYTQLSLTNPYIVLPLSLLVAILVYYRFGIRGGGYLVAPFLAAVTFSSPVQAALLAVGIALSYGAVRLALRYTLIIGLERFVFSLFCGFIVVTLLDLLAATYFIPGYRPSPLVLIIAVAVMTNDLSLQPLKSSLKNGFAASQVVPHLARWAV